MLSDDELYRALIVSNLISVHLKYYIGQLSAFFGAVTSACRAMSGIDYLKTKGDYKIICDTITNILMNVDGIVFDGEKASCAAKIFAFLNAGILGLNIVLDGIVFNSGDGLVLDYIESTIKNIGYLGRVGMKQTDVEILKAMIGQSNIEL
jgi:L-cysteine desulfidase